jgi:hypothetical protein
VKAWIAVGSAAYGVIFACGSIAIAPLCFGLFGLGFISVGLFSIGGLALGFLAIGLLAFGGGAIGWLASGAVAVGAQAAYGFSAYARTFAGIPTKHGKMPGAFALHANDLVAREFFARSRFFSLTGDCVHLVHEFPPRWSEGLGAACLLGVVFLMYEDFRRHRRAS